MSSFVRIIPFLLLSLCLKPAVSFGIMEAIPHANSLHDAISPLGVTKTILDQSLVSSTLASSMADESNAFMSRMAILGSDYKQALKANPYETKMATGVIIAIMGDAIAQLKDQAPYDVKRATAFAAFDGCYRAVQQLTYPPLIAQFQGQHLLSLLTYMGIQTGSLNSVVSYFGPLEQTLVSQLIIIPLLYYPVFFSVTGMVMGLSTDQTIERAKQTFVPLMKRNLLFWIPVQFAAFSYLRDDLIDLQIPVLILCGLVWTIILSVSAGSVKPKVDDYFEEDMLPEIAMSKMAGIADGPKFRRNALQEQEVAERRT